MGMYLVHQIIDTLLEYMALIFLLGRVALAAPEFEIAFSVPVAER